MVDAVFRTDDLPAPDRFDCWYQQVRTAILPAIISAERTDDFRAATRSLDLRTLAVHAMDMSEVRVNRPWKLVRESDPEQCHLILVVRGSFGFAQADTTARLGPGDLMFYNSSRPFEGWTGPDLAAPGATSAQIQVQIPRAAMPDPALADGLTGRRLPGSAGIPRLLARYLLELADPAAQYEGDDAVRIGTVTMDLISALLGHESETSRSLAPEARKRALLASIYGFMRDRLADPALAPDVVAAAHHISTRQLHKLFQGESLGVAAWIRRHRLERCRRDLSDPARRDRPIHAVAARWGFADNAHFSRLFRATYGIPARDYRHLALRGADRLGSPRAEDRHGTTPPHRGSADDDGRAERVERLGDGRVPDR